MTRQQKCRECGEILEAQVTWATDDVLQVLWYCDTCRSGWVRDVYFTGTASPSPFSEANLKQGWITPPFYSTLEGCPTDKEIQLMQDAADQEQEERDAWYKAHGMGKDWEAHGDFPDAPVEGAIKGVDYD